MLLKKFLAFTLVGEYGVLVDVFFFVLATECFLRAPLPSWKKFRSC